MKSDLYFLTDVRIIYSVLFQLAREASMAQTVLTFVLLTVKHVDKQTVYAHVRQVGWVITVQQVYLNVNNELELIVIN